VPKVKSSNSFFMHKSKFRFSGRCESELISSQHEASINCASPSLGGGSGGESVHKNNTSMLEVSTHHQIGPVFVTGQPSPTDSALSTNRYSSLQRPFKRYALAFILIHNSFFC
jgi:hypothetical protein